jgi:hypothetical protein
MEHPEAISLTVSKDGIDGRVVRTGGVLEPSATSVKEEGLDVVETINNRSNITDAIAATTTTSFVGDIDETSTNSSYGALETASASEVKESTGIVVVTAEQKSAISNNNKSMVQHDEGYEEKKDALEEVAVGALVVEGGSSNGPHSAQAETQKGSAGDGGGVKPQAEGSIEKTPDVDNNHNNTTAASSPGKEEEEEMEIDFSDEIPPQLPNDPPAIARVLSDLSSSESKNERALDGKLQIDSKRRIQPDKKKPTRGGSPALPRVATLRPNPNSPSVPCGDVSTPSKKLSGLPRVATIQPHKPKGSAGPQTADSGSMDGLKNGDKQGKKYVAGLPRVAMMQKTSAETNNAEMQLSSGETSSKPTPIKLTGLPRVANLQKPPVTAAETEDTRSAGDGTPGKKTLKGLPRVALLSKAAPPVQDNQSFDGASPSGKKLVGLPRVATLSPVSHMKQSEDSDTSPVKKLSGLPRVATLPPPTRKYPSSERADTSAPHDGKKLVGLPRVATLPVPDRREVRAEDDVDTVKTKDTTHAGHLPRVATLPLKQKEYTVETDVPKSPSKRLAGLPRVALLKPGQSGSPQMTKPESPTQFHAQPVPKYPPPKQETPLIPLRPTKKSPTKEERDLEELEKPFKAVPLPHFVAAESKTKESPSPPTPPTQPVPFQLKTTERVNDRAGNLLGRRAASIAARFKAQKGRSGQAEKIADSSASDKDHGNLQAMVDEAASELRHILASGVVEEALPSSNCSATGTEDIASQSDVQNDRPSSPVQPKNLEETF